VTSVTDPPAGCGAAVAVAGPVIKVVVARAATSDVRTRTEHSPVSVNQSVNRAAISSASAWRPARVMLTQVFGRLPS
jgi:hypothetical protein